MNWTKGKPRGMRTPAIDRVLARAKEDPATGCWVVTPATHGAGYAVVGRGGQHGGVVYCHRVTYDYFIHEIPAGLEIDHLCRNRACCNPWHLEPVTTRVNVLRGVGVSARAAAATHCPSGHAYDETNTYRNPNTGSRLCRACHREYAREWRRRHKQEGAA